MNKFDAIVKELALHVRERLKASENIPRIEFAIEVSGRAHDGDLISNTRSAVPIMMVVWLKVQSLRSCSMNISAALAGISETSHSASASIVKLPRNDDDIPF